LYGGFDAVYHHGSKIAAGLDQRPRTFDMLAEHFNETFPSLMASSSATDGAA